MRWCTPPSRLALRRGVIASGYALLLLAIAAGPARVAGAYRTSHSLAFQPLWAVAGLVRDLAAGLVVLAPFILLIAIALPARARWQSWGPFIAASPAALIVWLFGVAAEEVKVERGVYPTVFDLSSISSSTVFLRGALGFFRYDIYWIPAVVFWLFGVVLAARLRKQSNDDPVPRRPWGLGVAGALFVAIVVCRLLSAATASASERLSASNLGDPFQGIIDSGVDLVVYGKAATPRDLVRDADIGDGMDARGAALLGWPATKTHARPLDRDKEPAFTDARSRDLIRALEEVSENLFTFDEREVIVWQLTLESFRADDVHALNRRAAREIAPFVNGLYEAAISDETGDDVLASRATYQAGVRTAQGLGALSCGLGTLPYNLSLIRDLQPMTVRCLGDVLHDAGFRGTFFYGSDPAFDGMDRFFSAHGLEQQITQAELPKDLPLGAWRAVSDLALVNEATRHMAEAPESPRYVMLTSLSNHSPFDLPSDLPPEVTARVDHALEVTPNHALNDNRARLLTFSYTDAAVAHFFERLDRLGLAKRSIVVLAADHSTGENYLWGPEEGCETDDAKARIPFAIVLPRALRARVKDGNRLDTAVHRAQSLLDAAPISQNDIPSLVLTLLSAHPGIRELGANARWHTLGGQVTSPWFKPVSRPNAYVMGINGVSQFVVFDQSGARVGDYEESIFLKTRSDRTTVTPSLVPITATLSTLLRSP